MTCHHDKAFFYDDIFKEYVEEYLQNRYLRPGLKLIITANNFMCTDQDDSRVRTTFYIYGLRNKILYINHIAGSKNDCPTHMARHIEYVIDNNVKLDPDEFNFGYPELYGFKDRLMIIHTVEQYPDILDFKCQRNEFVVNNARAIFLDKQMKSLSALKKQIINKYKLDDAFNIHCTNDIAKPESKFFGEHCINVKYFFTIGSATLKTDHEDFVDIDADFNEINDKIISKVEKQLEVDGWLK